VGPSPSTPTLRWTLGVTAAVARRPDLWSTAVRQVGRLAPTGWWRQAPYLPLPDPAYLHFRMVTAYGGQGGEPHPADVVTYLHWCKAWPEVTSGH